MGLCNSSQKENYSITARDSDTDNNIPKEIESLNINDTEFCIKHKLHEPLEKQNIFENNIDISHLNNIIIKGDKYLQNGVVFEIQPNKCNNKCFYKSSQRTEKYLYYINYANSNSGRWQIGRNAYTVPHSPYYMNYDQDNEYKIDNNDPIAFVNSNEEQPYLIKNDEPWLLKKNNDFIVMNLNITEQCKNQLPQKTKVYDEGLTVHKRSIFHLSSHILFEYESIVLEEDSTLTTRPWNDKSEIGGKLFLKSRTDVILHKNSKITASKLGYIYNDEENKNDLTMLQLGKGGASYYDQHDGQTNGRGGGAVYIFCNRLIMEQNAIIETNGEYKRGRHGQGGSIYIIANYIAMAYGARIEARAGNYGYGMDEAGTIQLDISYFMLIDGYIRSNSNGLTMPVEIIELVIKFWCFEFSEKQRAIYPKPHITFK